MNEDDDFFVRLNTDDPYVKQTMDFMENAPPSMVSAYFERMHRRQEFESAMESIGGLTKCRRKMVVRALVRMFRAGCTSGRLTYRREMRYADLGATDGI